MRDILSLMLWGAGLSVAAVYLRSELGSEHIVRHATSLMLIAGGGILAYALIVAATMSRPIRG